MISISMCFWFLSGFAGGVLHGFGLRHSAANAGQWVAVIGLLRLVMVAALMVAAAILGHVLVAFAGWIVGFAVTVSFLFARVKPDGI